MKCREIKCFYYKLERLKNTLDEESREIKILDDKIRKKEYEHKHAKDVFDKIDKEMKGLENEKNMLLVHRGNVHMELLNLQRELEKITRSGNGASRGSLRA